METELLAPLFFVIISLVAGAILKYLLRKSAFPYTVGLFCLGILFGVLCRSGVLDDTGILGLSIESVGNISPDLILYIFLPILIFDAAYELDIHIFRKTLLNAGILAVPGGYCRFAAHGGDDNGHGILATRNGSVELAVRADVRRAHKRHRPCGSCRFA